VFELYDPFLIIGSYLLGAVPFGFAIAKARGVDIRAVGSGNIGATNVGRALGKKWGFFVFGLDVLKGLIPTMIARHLHGDEAGLAVVLTGFAAIAGHNWPVYLKFRGGKGVATSCGVFLAIFWQGVLIAFGLWVVVVAISRMVSLGSILASLGLLASAFMLQGEPLGRGLYVTLFAGLGALLSIIRHRANIGRILNGTENRIGGKKKEPKAQ
jgi:acyl phosphate:glycerol-3-phosphate acyltransferase